MILLLAVALSGVSWWGYDTAITANEWAAELAAVSDELDDEVERRRQLEGELAGTSSDLSRSEEDVRDLEQRIAALANEKARAEDGRQEVVIEASLYLLLLDHVQESSDWVNDCVDAMGDLQELNVEMWNLAATGVYMDVGPMNDLASTTYEYCNSARRYHAETVALIQSFR